MVEDKKFIPCISMTESTNNSIWVGGQGSGKKTTGLGVAFARQMQESFIGFGKSTFLNEALKAELHTLHRGKSLGRTYQQFINIVNATKDIKHQPIKIGVVGTVKSSMYKLLMGAEGFEPVLLNKNPKFLNGIIGDTYELAEIFKESKLSVLEEIENIVPSRADQGLRHKFNMRGGKW